MLIMLEGDSLSALDGVGSPSRRPSFKMKQTCKWTEGMKRDRNSSSEVNILPLLVRLHRRADFSVSKAKGEHEDHGGRAGTPSFGKHRGTLGH